jgi:putative phage-type endonuclease
MKLKIKKIPNINARDFSTILNINPYQTPFQLLESKIENKYPFFGNKFTEHGNMYEKHAINVYSKQTGNIVNTDQKNVKHSNYEWITGRYDGIITLNNDSESVNEEEEPKRKRRKIDRKNYCIVEVKCPLKNDREEPLHIDNIPKYYWAQCQVYMNILDCDSTHYVEYYIDPESSDKNSGKLYYVDIKRDRQWWEESLPRIEKFYEEMKIYHQKGSLDTHPVRIVEKEWEKIFN